MRYLLVFFMVIFAFGDITETKVFSKNIKSNVLQTRLEITIENKQISNVVKEIDNILKIINKYNFCKNNGYSIFPKYYKNKFVSYQTKLKLNCRFVDTKIKLFTQLLSKVQNHVIYINNLKYVVPKEIQKKVLKELKIKAFNYGLNKTKELSKVLKKRCFVKNVEFNHYQQNVLYKKMSFYQNAVPLPQNNGKDLILNVNYKFICF